MLIVEQISMPCHVLSLKTLHNYQLIVPLPNIFTPLFNFGNISLSSNLCKTFFFSLSSLVKDHRQRPKYGALMTHSFFIQSSEQPVDVAGWYQQVTTTATTSVIEK